MGSTLPLNSGTVCRRSRSYDPRAHEETHILMMMASKIEKVLFGAGLGLAGSAAIYLYRRRREEQERDGSNVNMEVPQSKAKSFPFTKMPGSDIKGEGNFREKADVLGEHTKQLPKKDKSALDKKKETLHGNQEEKKGEDVALFSWFMGRQGNEDRGAEEKKE